MRSLLPVASLAIFSLFSHSLAQGKQTTIVGPTSFCQGLSPGGNSCITVSRGCYIIAPTDNVVPSVHCTASPSTTTAKHYTNTTHPNPSSTGRVTTKKTSKKKTTTTTDHTKTTTTLHTKTTTTKPTKTTTTPTTTATTNPSTDLKEASKEAKSAQTAVKKYQQDPTNKSLAQAAEKAINKAKTKSKHAVNSAKNSSLEKFAKDLFDSLDTASKAAAAAVAGPSAATASSLAAAAAAAAAAAEAADQALNNHPTTTPPTGTKTTKTTTSTLACSTVTIDESDPDYSPPPVDESLPLLRRWQGRYDLIKRAADERKVTFCDGKYKAESPLYEPFHTNGVGNIYSPFYTKTVTTRYGGSCYLFSWKLTPEQSRVTGATYAAEHIFEIQLIKRFFEWVEKNDANVKTILQEQGTSFCTTIFQPTFIKEGWSKDFGNVRIIDKLYAQLSGTPISAEMAYLDKDINGLKAKILVDKKLTSPNGIKVLPKVAQVAMVAEYMKTTKVTKVWKDTSARIWGIFKQVDTSLADQSNTIPASLRTIDWAAGYNKWEKQLLEAATKNMQTYAQQGVKKALKYIQIKERIKLAPNGDPVSGGTVAGRAFYKRDWRAELWR